MKIGITVAIKALTGTFANPDAPSAIKVNKGPSFNASNAMAAESVSSP
ncbi:hypothetical protein SDC9_167813 [bioreactor metagenome]|uniref:Uncharacterized protein n=1 Tax=bioreactor metagenome TaxID=1076179 RepID=A0A645G8L3_9ZZZZ